ncbi:hypothetical protein I4U23_001329 [Adineta vaga]|nr:hypothetical protein I4U23_001329 [Adineta vaga]
MAYRNIVHPAAYDIEYYIPPRTRVVQRETYDSYPRRSSWYGACSWCSLWCCLLSLLGGLLLAAGLAVALVFIIRSANKDETTQTTIRPIITLTTRTSTTTTSTTTTTTTSSITTNEITLISSLTDATNSCYYGGDLIHLLDGTYKRIDQLQVGDRLWSLTKDGKRIIEDEMILMMYADANNSILFYTFTTYDGYSISLTSNHYIIIFDSEHNKIMYISASKVTQAHHLILSNRTSQIKKINKSVRKGFYSPLTLSGSLLVNNISTSVYIANYGISPETFHKIFTPIRIYYRFTRWIFGNDYNPYTNYLKHGLHPLGTFLKANQNLICILLVFENNILWILLTLLIIYSTQKYLLVKST